MDATRPQDLPTRTPRPARPRWLAGALALAVFAIILLTLGHGPYQAADEAVLRALRHPEDPAHAWGPRWLTEVARDVTALGSVAVHVLAVGTLAVGLALAGRRRTAARVLLLTTGGYLLGSLLKGVVDRPRPTVVPTLAHVFTRSFPSSHAMMSAVVFLTLGVTLAEAVKEARVRRFVLGVAIGLTVLVGLSRVYLGVHYPSDVLGGWALGAAWALGGMWLGRAVYARWRK